jgi:CheY-like chemotaxis protein
LTSGDGPSYRLGSTAEQGRSSSGAAPVLIVDDDSSTRTFVAHVLERVGIATRLASTGIEALELAAEQRPPAVLLDISMPGISGYETCHELRELYGTALPIIFLSGERVESYDRAAST